MKYEKKVCVIVDAFSTGRYLAPMLRANGYDCVHVQSLPEIPPMYVKNFKVGDFIENIVFTGDMGSLSERLGKYAELKMIIPGCESGVILADRCAARFGFPVNDMSLLEARRDKYLMTKAVHDSGINTVRFIQADMPEPIIEWMKKEPSRPIVVKPVDSAGGDNIHFCNNEEEVRAAVKEITESNNIFGVPNARVIAQTFAPGQEYVVNTVNLPGYRFVTDVWCVTKKPGTAAYDICELVSPVDPVYPILTAYTFNVLEALGVNYGAGHTEIKYDEVGGPLLIESAARLMGAAEISFATEMYGYNQVSILLESYLAPDDFKCRVGRIPTFKFERGVNVLLMSDRDGKITKGLSYITDMLRSLETIHSFNVYPKEGDLIRRTVDMATCPGTIYLIGNHTAVERDYLKIRNFEKDFAYEKAIEPLSPSKRGLKLFGDAGHDVPVGGAGHDIPEVGAVDGSGALPGCKK